MTEKLRLQISVSDKIDIYEFLKTVVEKQGDGVCAYKDRWSDGMVYDHLKHTIPRLSQRHVENVRADKFGSLEGDRAKPTRPINNGQLERLTKMIEAHSKTLTCVATAFDERIRTLEDELKR